jgi:hypothetical protein
MGTAGLEKEHGARFAKPQAAIPEATQWVNASSNLYGDVRFIPA